MIRRLLIQLFIPALILTVNPLFAKSMTAEQPLDQIIVTVNDSPIMQSELNEAMQNIHKQLMSQGTPLPSEAQLKKQVLDQLISHKLQMQTADQAGVHASAEEVEQTLT